jgi:hypothetical protein
MTEPNVPSTREFSLESENAELRAENLGLREKVQRLENEVTYTADDRSVLGRMDRELAQVGHYVHDLGTQIKALMSICETTAEGRLEHLTRLARIEDKVKHLRCLEGGNGSTEPCPFEPDDFNEPEAANG